MQTHVLAAFLRDCELEVQFVKMGETPLAPAQGAAPQHWKLIHLKFYTCHKNLPLLRQGLHLCSLIES